MVCVLAGHPDLVRSLVMNSPLAVSCDLRQNHKTGRRDGKTWAVNVRDMETGLRTWLNTADCLCPRYLSAFWYYSWQK